MVLGAVACSLYLVDAHRMCLLSFRIAPSETLNTNISEGDIAVEAFTCLLVFKNVFSFGLTWGAYHWLVQAGILKVFYVIASVQVGICLLSIPMCKIWHNVSQYLHFNWC